MAQILRQRPDAGLRWTRVERQWTVTRRRVSVDVSTGHPRYGLLGRGTVRLAGGEGCRSRWTVTDYDATPVGEITGDYVDAERLLLDATTELEV